jgi:hypothetical protein
MKSIAPFMLQRAVPIVLIIELPKVKTPVTRRLALPGIEDRQMR